MAKRKIPFVTGEFYHIYNRGVDKRNLFVDKYDFERFLQSMSEFNVLEPIGSIYENSRIKSKSLDLSKFQSEHKITKLVNFIAYCVNPNHYHFLLEQVVDKGIEKFMQRLGNGYTKYFNNKHERVGSLFQGVFKSININSNEYLLHLSAYVNLNAQVHKFGHEVSKFSKSSFDEYLRKNSENFCNKDIILDQYQDFSEYGKFAVGSLRDILNRREEKEIKEMLLE